MKKLFVIPLLAALAACQTVQETAVVAPRLPIAAPQPAPVYMRDLHWKVVNKAEMERILASDKNPDYVIFALTPEGFKALAYNVVELKRYIQEQQEVIAFYKRVSETTNDVEQADQKLTP